MALLADKFQKQGKDVLVIDADPSPHMAETLGIDNIDELKPIAEMTQMLSERAEKTPGSPFYQINPKVDDLMDKYMIKHKGLRLMVLGAIQTAEGGCACPENTVLKRLLTKLLLSPSQVVLLDMEAGVEHLGRGTIAGVDHLLIVVIPTNSSVRTALKIQKLASDSGIPKISFVGNLIQDEEDKVFLIEALGEKPAAFFSSYSAIRKAERKNQPIADIIDQLGDAPDLLINYLMAQ